MDRRQWDADQKRKIEGLTEVLDHLYAERAKHPEHRQSLDEQIQMTRGLLLEEQRRQFPG